METTDIGVINLITGLLLMAVPVYFQWKYSTGMVRGTVSALLRMVVQLFLVGLYLKYLFIWNSPLLNIAWVLAMVLVATETSLSRTNLKRKTTMIPLLAGFFIASVSVGIYFLAVVLRLDNPFEARYFIPIFGILMGNMLGVNVIGLNTFYNNLFREKAFYHYMVANGATTDEATKSFIKQAITRAFAPAIANMAVMGLVALPGTMIGQILGGSNPDVAIKYQMMIIVITISSSMLSLMITLNLSKRYIIDDMSRITDPFKENNKGNYKNIRLHIFVCFRKKE